MCFLLANAAVHVIHVGLNYKTAIVVSNLYYTINEKKTGGFLFEDSARYGICGAQPAETGFTENRDGLGLTVVRGTI